MSDPAPAATFQNSAEDLVKRNAACVETRQARNTCITERGEANCKDVIEAHKECMRKAGFGAN